MPLFSRGAFAAPTPRWRLDYLFVLARASWLIHICVVILTSVVLLQGGVVTWPHYWLAAMVLLSLGMVALAFAWRRRAPMHGHAYGIAHTILTGIIGLGWGTGAISAALTGHDMLTFFTLALGGTALGAVSSQHALPRSALVSVWSSIPLLASAYLVQGVNQADLATALMMLLFGIVLSILAVRMNRFLTENFELSQSLADKVAALSQTKAELEKAHAARSGFLAQASHDLRQPIHAIGLFVEYLSGLRIGREGRDVLNHMDRALDSLARLCRSLLDISALDVGRVKPVIAPVALDDVLGEVLRQATESARRRGVALSYVPSRAWVSTDAALLHTMVQNIVSNAVKYAPGARVLLGVRRRAGALSVEVLDAGPGIAAADQQRIFHEFVRLDTPAAPHMEGLGLGLAIVKRLADLLGLTIRLTSQPGRGTRFAIDGLVITSPRAQREAPLPKNYATRLNTLRVLVVDDDPVVRESTALLLARWGCSVQASARVEDIAGLGAAFDFLLCDQDLGGGMTGSALIARIRAEAGGFIPAAIITGNAPEPVMESVEGQAIQVLLKPVRPAQLRSVLLAAVSQTSPISTAMAAAAARDGTSSARSSAET